MFFELLETNGMARRGKITTARGVVNTPAFMPVGTQGAIKGGICPEDLRPSGAQIQLGNTFHLHLRPGEEVIESLGGIQKFSAWNGPMLTDSGGFQVFSLSKIRKITDDGVEFRSPVDGRKIFFTPEKVMEIEHALGADIIMIFDECPPYLATYEQVKKAVIRTTAWAKRCKIHHEKLLQEKKKKIALFGIIQGGIFPDLREQSARELMEIGFDGYAIGGLSVGEPNAEMYRICEMLNALLPHEKPRYLMGVGTPADLRECMARGIDMFDCVMPTRNGRHGKAFTSEGEINIRNEKYERDKNPIDPECSCPCCRQFSRAALRHFFKCGEPLGARMLSLHNLWFYQKIVRENGNFSNSITNL